MLSIGTKAASWWKRGVWRRGRLQKVLGGAVGMLRPAPLEGTWKIEPYLGLEKLWGDVGNTRKKREQGWGAVAPSLLPSIVPN